MTSVDSTHGGSSADVYLIDSVRKLSLPSLLKGTIEINNDESFMYLVDSLPVRKNTEGVSLVIKFCNKTGHVTNVVTRSLSAALQAELTEKWGNKWSLSTYECISNEPIAH
jgi:hypothetical protein